MITLNSISAQVGRVLQVCATDSRVAEYVNRAEKRLLPVMKAVGTVARYRICSNDACLTWPRQIETIEAYAIDSSPGVIRSEWYEFLGTGPGIVASNQYVGATLIDRGLACAFDDVRWLNGNAPYLRVYVDTGNGGVAVDAGKRILLKYIDWNGNKVFTEEPAGSGNYIEGEYVTLVAAPAYAVTQSRVLAGGLYEVQKPITAQVVRLYCWDQTTNTQYPLAYYEPSETLPRYRRSLIPYLTQMQSCATLPCLSKWVTVMAKLRHVDVVVGTDSLVLECEEAILKEVESIYLGEPPRLDKANSMAAHLESVRLLDEQLRSHLGDGPLVNMRFENPEIYGGGGVTAFNWS